MKPRPPVWRTTCAGCEGTIYFVPSTCVRTYECIICKKSTFLPQKPEKAPKPNELVS